MAMIAESGSRGFSPPAPSKRPQSLKIRETADRNAGWPGLGDPQPSRPTLYHPERSARIIKADPPHRNLSRWRSG